MKGKDFKKNKLCKVEKKHCCLPIWRPVMIRPDPLPRLCHRSSVTLSEVGQTRIEFPLPYGSNPPMGWTVRLVRATDNVSIAREGEMVVLTYNEGSLQHNTRIIYEILAPNGEVYCIVTELIIVGTSPIITRSNTIEIEPGQTSFEICIPADITTTPVTNFNLCSMEFLTAVPTTENCYQISANGATFDETFTFCYTFNANGLAYLVDQSVVIRSNTINWEIDTAPEGSVSTIIDTYNGIAAESVTLIPPDTDTPPPPAPAIMLFSTHSVGTTPPGLTINLLPNDPTKIMVNFGEPLTETIKFDYQMTYSGGTIIVHQIILVDRVNHGGTSIVERCKEVIIDIPGSVIETPTSVSVMEGANYEVELLHPANNKVKVIFDETLTEPREISYLLHYNNGAVYTVRQQLLIREPTTLSTSYQAPFEQGAQIKVNLPELAEITAIELLAAEADFEVIYTPGNTYFLLENKSGVINGSFQLLYNIHTEAGCIFEVNHSLTAKAPAIFTSFTDGNWVGTSYGFTTFSPAGLELLLNNEINQVDIVNVSSPHATAVVSSATPGVGSTLIQFEGNYSAPAPATSQVVVVIIYDVSNTAEPGVKVRVTQTIYINHNTVV